MTATAPISTGLRRDSFGWRSMVWVLAIAFVLQSYVVQTHIHGASASLSSAAKTVSQPVGHGKAPAGDSGMDCPYCQAIMHAGSFLAPTAPLLSLPSLWIACAAQPGCPAALSLSPAHSWQSRAPPPR